MIPQIASALTGGYTTKQIMQFLIRQFPQHADKIKGALKAGFTADQVVKFLGGGRKGVNQETEGLTEHEQVRSKDMQRRENVNQGALKGAGMAALAGGTALAAPMAKSALQRAAPQLFGPGAITSSSNTGLGPSSNNTGSPSPTQAPQIPQANLISPSSSQPPVSPNIPQQSQPNQPKLNTTNINELVNKHGLTKHIESLSSNVKDPKAIAGILYNKFPREMKKFQEEAGIPMEDAISEYMQSNVKPLDIEEPDDKLGFKEAFKTMEEGAPTNKLYEGIFESLKNGKDTFAGIKDPLISKAKPYFDKGIIKSPEDLKRFVNNPEEFQQKEPSKIEKGSTVASPQGIGEIKEIRNGKAIIEIDGKKHQVDEDELIESPLPEKDLADLYDDLISGIEKTTGKQVSRNVDWAGYDPGSNELAYKPHGSDKLYVYGDISERDIEVLTKFLSQRKSTGSNFIGAWQAGSESPIGAAMYQLIKELQEERGGKGNEYKNKYETIYDAIEPAKKAAKARHAERKKKAKKPRPN